MIALVDGDIVAYRCAASIWDYKTGKNKAPLKVARYRIDDMLNGIALATRALTVEIFLSDSHTFRNEIYPAYKANREGMKRPKHLNACKNYLVRKYKAKVYDGIEADDALGIAQCEENGNTVICSIDKDLHQIPGYHYNFVKGSKKEVTPMGGLRHFYKQLLIGDTADNVIGARGIGTIKADRLIDPLDSHEEMFDCVRAVYKDDVRLMINCDVLWILQKPNEVFTTRYKDMLRGFNLNETEISKEQREKTSELGTRSDT